MIERTIAASVHGRYLIAPPAAPGPAPLLVGLHGYAETAEIQLDRLRMISAPEQWLIVSVQGLHTFYRGRSQDVVASWMTHQQRELMISDNIAYVTSLVDTVAREWPLRSALVFAGFSQGVGMAFRAAAGSSRPVDGVITVGGDVPPELSAADLSRTRSALVGRGSRDDWYTPEKFADDVERLRQARVDVRAIEFDGGHEWSEEFAREASSFLETFSVR